MSCESEKPGNGVAVLDAKSGASDDLEDGEIFDDDDPVEVFKGGGEDKPQLESPPSFKNKSPNANERKKGKDKRSGSAERRDKRADRPQNNVNNNNRNNGPMGGKRKRNRENEDDHRPPNKPPKQRKMNEKNKLGGSQQPSLDEEVDENEMVYVMGGNSPTATKDPMNWDGDWAFSDDEDGDRERGEGGGGERGGGGRGRRGREGFHSSNRMSRRARLGRGGNQANNAQQGGKRSRFNRKQNNDQAICKFFLQGKCQRIRGNDCPFSHGALPSKKMELCKFYMSDRCTKKDKCMYMHRDFPCKFYHTGQKCYAGKRCKFYHGKISNFLRSVLMKHLENRELQNEFDKYKEQYEKKDRNRSGGRGGDRFQENRPSRSDDEGEGGSTPMPSPQREEFEDERERCSPSPEHEREKRRRRNRRRRRSRDGEEEDDIGGMRMNDEKEDYYMEDEEGCRGEGEGWHHQNNMEDHPPRYNDFHQQRQHPPPPQPFCMDQMQQQQDYFIPDDYGEEEDQDNIPANLPKTQRKLFMRIQQQNKKSDSRRREDSGRDEEFKEENWYSSDEENNSGGNNVGKNVGVVPPFHQGLNPNSVVPLMNAPVQPPPLMANMIPQPPPPVSLPNMFDNIDLSAVTKILTTVRESIQKKNNEQPMDGPSGVMEGPPPMGPMGGMMGGPMGPLAGIMGGPPMGGMMGPGGMPMGMGGPCGPMGPGGLPLGGLMGPGGPPMGGPGGPPMGGPGGPPMGGPGGPPMGGPGGPPMGGPGGPPMGGGPGGPTMGGPGGPPMGGPMMSGPGGSLMGGPGGPPMGGPGGPMNSPSGARAVSQDSPSSSPQHSQSNNDERRFRDPRLRSGESGERKNSSVSLKPLMPAPVLLTKADLDLRLSDPPPSCSQDSPGSDIDLRHLPFKPAPLHHSANEIDASISSGPPVDYKLSSLLPVKPDYAQIASRSNPQTCANDPRLSKYVTPKVLAQYQMVVAQALPSGATKMLSPPHTMSPPLSQPPQQISTSSRTEEAVVSRDPRNRGGVANDPRRRNQNPVSSSAASPTTQTSPSHAFQPQGQQPFPPHSNPFGPPFNGPPQPFADPQSLHQDNDFRLGLLPQQVQQTQHPFGVRNVSDIDLRIQQPRYYQ